MRFTIKLKLGLSFGLIILLLTCAAGYAVMAPLVDAGIQKALGR